MAESFIFPSQGYACLQCGKSCLSGWRVWLEPESYERLNAHPLTAQLRRGGYEPLAVYPTGPAALVPPGGGPCCYLSPETLCELHRAGGPETKPRTCQHFPFSLLETPDGCQVGVTFRCTAVQQDHGQSWDMHVATLERLRATGTYPRVGFEPIEAGIVLDWAGYRRWEARALQMDLWDVLAELLEVPGTLALRACLEAPLARQLVAWVEGDGSIVEQIEESGAFWLARLGAVVRWDTAESHEPYAQHLRRFIHHLIERKFLLLGPHFRGRLTVLALLESVSNRYARWEGLANPSPVAAFWQGIERLEAQLIEGEDPFFQAVERVVVDLGQRVPP